MNYSEKHFGISRIKINLTNFTGKKFLIEGFFIKYEQIEIVSVIEICSYLQKNH